MKEIKTGRRYGRLSRYGCLLLLCLFLEIFIFNFRHWESLAFEAPVDFTVTYDRSFSEEDGSFTSSGEEMTILLSGMDGEIENLKLDAEGALFTVRLTVWDEGNSGGKTYPERSYHPDVAEEHYIRLNPAGRVEKIQVALSHADGQPVTIREISLDQTRPIVFRWDRFFVIAAVGLLLMALKNKSSFLYADTREKNRAGEVLYALTVGCIAFICVAVICGNETAVTQPYSHHDQYARLAEAMSRGHVYLDTDPQPSEALMAMENPYDTQAREAADVDHSWDTAYYNGKYYVYFGVVPVLFCYLPWYLLTGQALPNYMVICLGLIFVLTVMAFLIRRLAWKLFNGRLPAVYVWLSFVQLAVGGAAAVTLRQASFYVIPILFGLGFGGLGILLWTRASEERVKRPRLWIAFGALSLSLVAGCRPQLLVMIFPAVFALKKCFAKENGRERARDLGAAFLPAAAVAIGLMAYNAARFGSPFDFGSAYNLTTNDMTRRGFRLDRLGLILFTYLFQPLNVESQFPFISPARVATMYQGTTIVEPIFGGLLFLMPITLILFSSGSRRVRESGLLPLIVALTGGGVIVAVADGQMAGLLTRYYLDFAALLLVAAFITGGVWLAGRPAGDRLCRIFSALLAFGTAACILMIFRDGSGFAVEENMPLLYHKVMTAIQFWM